jgi:crotonobetainyl-CoA:carnitine CoA-transferase CaiB-like acyl-CoA transferase
MPGYDLVIQATSGLMGITGEPDGEPMKVGVAIADIITGLYAVVSALAGLHARGKGQGGAAFDLALADCTLASLVNVAQSALVTGKRPTRYGNAHAQIVPYEVFPTADGHIVLAVGNDSQWQRVCAAAGWSDLATDVRYASNPMRVRNRGELIPRLQQEFSQRTTEVWLKLFAPTGVPHCAVATLDEALRQPQTLARGMVAEVVDGAGRKFKVLGSPVHWQGEDVRSIAAPPLLGEHTDEVLRDWTGYDDAQLVRLRNEGIIA